MKHLEVYSKTICSPDPLRQPYKSNLTLDFYHFEKNDAPVSEKLKSIPDLRRVLQFFCFLDFLNFGGLTNQLQIGWILSLSVWQKLRHV